MVFAVCYSSYGPMLCIVFAVCYFSCRPLVYTCMYIFFLFQLKCCGVSGDANSSDSWAIYKTKSEWFKTGESGKNTWYRGWIYVGCKSTFLSSSWKLRSNHCALKFSGRHKLDSTKTGLVRINFEWKRTLLRQFSWIVVDMYEFKPTNATN